MVRRLFLITAVLAGLWLGGLAKAEEFKLTTGEVVIGELLAGSANDTGVQIKVGEGEYKRVSWANFSQEDLKQFQKLPKLAPLVEPFIEITQEEKLKKTEVNIKQPPRLELPVSRSLVGAMFSSGLGTFVLLLLYAANIYAAYEVSIFRARPVALVCGVSAVLPVVGPIIFLSMPTNVVAIEQTWDAPPAAPVEGAQGEAVNPMQAEDAPHPTGLRLAKEEPAQTVAVGQFQGEVGKAAMPETVTYQRGQFTFNRRFFETKFPGFFGVIKRDADKDMVLVIKSARGTYTAERISRIAANDLHIAVHHGHTSEEVMVPFVEVQEIKVKHRDAK